MNGKEIQSLINKDAALKIQFLGVFAANELSSHIPVGKGLIVNCCKRKLPGHHWLALYQSSVEKVEFFDSYGRKPCFYGLNPIHIGILGALWYLGGHNVTADFNPLSIPKYVLKVDDIKTQW